MKRSFDLHGKLVAEAEELFHQLLNESRMGKKLIEVEFITGTGKIWERLQQLSNDHGLYHYIPWANRGMIIVEFE